MPRIEMERNDSPIDTSMAIAGHRCHKMELRAPERASISVLLHWLLWNAYIVFLSLDLVSEIEIPAFIGAPWFL